LILVKIHSTNSNFFTYTTLFRSYIYSDLNAAHFVNCECGNPRPEENDYYNRKCKETEAAGQEQETAEAFLKAMKPQVANFDKHRSEEHTSELQSRENLVCRLLLE